MLIKLHHAWATVGTESGNISEIIMCKSQKLNK